MTWFKKDKRIKWFNIKAKSYPGSVEKMVAKWYKK
jgi:tRNA A37 N6-isopentenylltransferase MiaA